MKLTKEIIKDQFLEAEKTLEEIPTRKWWKENSKSLGYASAISVYRTFGSWNNALVEVFGMTNISSPKAKSSVSCDTCGKSFIKKPSQIRSNRDFCSRDCFYERIQ